MKAGSDWTARGTKSVNQNSGRYQLLNSDRAPLAYGEMENPAETGELRIRIPQDKIRAVLRQENVWLVKEGEDTQEFFKRVVGSEGDMICLGEQDLGRSLRQNLRIPTNFDTFVYPLGNDWKGRRQVTSYDLSCGGIAFFSDCPFKIGDKLEVVIPATPKPLVLAGEVIRQETTEDGQTLYALKFTNLCDGEEAMVREEVFSIQLRQREQ